MPSDTNLFSFFPLLWSQIDSWRCQSPFDKWYWPAWLIVFYCIFFRPIEAVARIAKTVANTNTVKQRAAEIVQLHLIFNEPTLFLKNNQLKKATVSLVSQAWSQTRFVPTAFWSKKKSLIITILGLLEQWSSLYWVIQFPSQLTKCIKVI